jgi:hypothetical protein
VDHKWPLRVIADRFGELTPKYWGERRFASQLSNIWELAFQAPKNMIFQLSNITVTGGLKDLPLYLLHKNSDKNLIHCCGVTLYVATVGRYTTLKGHLALE